GLMAFLEEISEPVREVNNSELPNLNYSSCRNRWLFGRVRMRRMRSLTADPHLAAFEMFFLPNRHDFLEAIDRKAAGLEGFRAMRRRYCNRHRGLPDLDHSDSMRHRDAGDFPSTAGLLGELANLRKRHRLVGFVFEAQDLAADVVLAGGSDESAD